MMLFHQGLHMVMMKMKISDYKPSIILIGVYCFLLIGCPSLGTSKEKSSEMTYQDNSLKALKYNSVSVYSVSTGVSHETDEEEYF